MKGVVGLTRKYSRLAEAWVTQMFRALLCTSREIDDAGDCKILVEALYAARIAILGRIRVVVRQVQRLRRCDGCHGDRCSSTGVHMPTFHGVRGGNQRLNKRKKQNGIISREDISEISDF